MLLFMILIKYANINLNQASAVEAIHKLAEANKQTQKDLLDKGAERLLMQMLKKNRYGSFVMRITCPTLLRGNHLFVIIENPRPSSLGLSSY